MPRRAQVIIEISDEGNIQVGLQGHISACEAVFAIEQLKHAILEKLTEQRMPALKGMPSFTPRGLGLE